MGRFTDQLYKDQAIEDSLALAKAKSDSTMQALQQLQTIKAKRDSLIKAKEEPSIDYQSGIFDDPRGMKHRVPELTGGGIFSEGSRGEQPMFKLAGGFIPVPNLGWNKMPLDQPSSYIEKDELGYLSGGFEAPPSSLMVALDNLEVEKGK